MTETPKIDTYLYQNVVAATRPTTPTKQHVPTIAKIKAKIKKTSQPKSDCFYFFVSLYCASSTKRENMQE